MFDMIVDLGPLAKTGAIIDMGRIVGGILQVQNKYIDLAITRGKKYPAKLPGQRYVRTGRIGRSWKRIPSHLQGPDTIEAAANNTAVEPARAKYRKSARYYPPYVFGSHAASIRQAAIHRNRWPLESELIDQRAYEQEVYQVLLEAVS